MSMGKMLHSKPIMPNSKAIPIRENATGNPEKMQKSMLGNIRSGRYSELITRCL
jgi:hypothetical protein